MLRVNLPIKHLAITALIALISLEILGVSPNFWSDSFVWDNEKLIAFDHLRLILDGAELVEINLARIPSLFPDYLVALLTQPLSQDINTQYTFFVFTSSFLQVVLSASIVRRITSASMLSILLIFSLFVTITSSISPDWSSNISLSLVPVNHGGNALALLLSLLLILTHIGTPKGTKSSLLLLLISATFTLAAISNKIFLIQASIPSIAVLVILQAQKRRTNPSRLPLLTFSISISSAIGYLLSTKLRSGCNPPIHFDGEFLIRLLADHLKFSSNPTHIGLGILIISSLIAIWVTPFADRKDPAIKFFKVFASLSITSSIILAAYISQNSGSLAANSRYLLSTILLSGIGLLSLLIQLIKNASLVIWPKGRVIANIALAMTIILTALPIATKGIQSLKAIRSWENPYSEFIRANIPSGASLLTMYEGDHYLSSRSLKAGTNWEIHVSQIASNGEPNPWDQGKSEFYSDQKTKQIRDYQAIILKDSDASQAISWYGKPIQIERHPELAVQLWIYGKEGVDSIKGRIKTPLKYGFKVECS